MQKLYTASIWNDPGIKEGLKRAHGQQIIRPVAANMEPALRRYRLAGLVAPITYFCVELTVFIHLLGKAKKYTRTSNFIAKFFLSLSFSDLLLHLINVSLSPLMISSIFKGKMGLNQKI